jgi:hypothetical protein
MRALRTDLLIVLELLPEEKHNRLSIGTRSDLPLNEGNRNTYYLPGNFTPFGYTDYPFVEEKGEPLDD